MRGYTSTHSIQCVIFTLYLHVLNIYVTIHIQITYTVYKKASNFFFVFGGEVNGENQAIENLPKTACMDFHLLLRTHRASSFLSCSIPYDRVKILQSNKAFDSIHTHLRFDHSKWPAIAIPTL